MRLYPGLCYLFVDPEVQINYTYWSIFPHFIQDECYENAQGAI